MFSGKPGGSQQPSRASLHTLVLLDFPGLSLLRFDSLQSTRKHQCHCTGIMRDEPKAAWDLESTANSNKKKEA